MKLVVPNSGQCIPVERGDEFAEGSKKGRLLLVYCRGGSVWERGE